MGKGWSLGGFSPQAETSGQNQEVGPVPGFHGLTAGVIAGESVEIALLADDFRAEIHHLTPSAAAAIVAAAAPAVTGLLVENFTSLMVAAQLVAHGVAVAPLLLMPGLANTALAVAALARTHGITPRAVEPSRRELLEFVMARPGESPAWRRAVAIAIGDALQIAALPETAFLPPPVFVACQPKSNRVEKGSQCP